MCGIAGFRDVGHSLNADKAESALRRMTHMLVHRGPDDEGYFNDRDAGLSLGFRRLAIMDLSSEGHQPMASLSGRYVMVFNGEVYNHTVLRSELEKVNFVFRGHSDTEVMLAAIDYFGLEPALKRFNGMFALAIWDRKERALMLARDRVGIKPLYYGWVGPLFVFASELKAITAIPGFANPIDRNALAAYLRFSYVPTPYSIYQGIHKLEPGTFLTIDSALASAKPDAETLASRSTTYWSARDVAESNNTNRFKLSDDEASNGLEELLRDAVATRMEADVPLGALLSGGIDSSMVVALMQAQSREAVKTYSIGFDEGNYDEAGHAKAVARHLRTEHTELYVSHRQAMDVIPSLPTLYGEPFGDSSQIPTFLVSQLAGKSVTVALSGDGGDELFGGYNRYLWVPALWRRFHQIPRPARQAVANAIRFGSPASWDRVFATTSPILPSRFRVSIAGHKMHRLADVLGDRTMAETYRNLASQWPAPASIVLDAREPQTMLDDAPALGDFTERMMWMDFATYLRDDILTKLDRASMSVSLEARVPLLDHRLAEFAWRLPKNFKIREGQGKWLLRQVLYRYVPRELIDRPKQGFTIPLEHWLRGPLREWAEELLDERRIAEAGYFDPAPIRKAWREHLSGRHNRQHHLWSVLMFQAWLESNGSQ
jgi:asparagine synthase (glutamine-hydrolysing)